METASDWTSRLESMEDWYRDLLASGTAESLLDGDYAPHRAYLSRLRGKVIDLGGGAGVAGRYLHPDCDHVVVDPSAVWNEPAWRDLGNRFTGPRATRFVQGVGESLPFADAEFDAGIAFWSLNHAQDPAACVRELARVVRTGGPVLLVLEDMEPTWRDFARCVRQRIGTAWGGKVDGYGFFGSWRISAYHKLAGRPWPLQDDHCRIVEADLMRWTAPYLRLQHRAWRGGYLTLEFFRT